MSKPVDENLRQYATARQWEIYQAVQEHGSNKKTAEKLGVGRRVVDKSMVRMMTAAARGGYAPEQELTRKAAPGFVLKGHSDFINEEDGTLTRRWLKYDADKEQQFEAMKIAAQAMGEDIPKVPSMKYKGEISDDNLLNCFVITDFHLGALSWQPETGADWDMDIAESTLVEWFRQAIAQAPSAKTALLAQISDLLHWDGFDAVTPASKHLLDADTRFPKLVRVAIRVLRQIIGMLLAKHENLHIIMADANHDPVSQVWLREWLAVMYEQEPRVTVDTSPSPYNAYEFGNVAIFAHHGHKRKPGNVSEVFAGKFRELFGRTKHAYAHMGHMHHLDVKENNLMIVEQHRTLAAPDAYAARGGYLSGRDAKCITYHREFGEVGRLTVSYDMVSGVAA